MTTKHALTAEDLRNLNIIGDPQLSPDGQTLAMIRTRITDEDEYETHLFVQKHTDNEPKQWTFGSGRVFSPRFSPDGQTLAYTRTKAKGEKPQLYLQSLDGGEAKQVTELDGGAGEPFWAPDGRRVLFSTSFEGGQAVPAENEDTVNNNGKDEKSKPFVVERLKYKSDAAGFHDGKTKQLAVLTVSDGQVEFFSDDVYDHTPNGWSPDGEQIVYTANKAPDDTLISDIYTVDTKTNEHTCLTGQEGMFSNGTFSPDGKTIACFGHEKEYLGATQAKVWLLDPLSSKRSVLTASWDVNVGDTMIGDSRAGDAEPGPVFSKNGDAVYVRASTNGNTQLYHVSLRNGDVTQLTHGEQHVYSASIDPDRGEAVVGISTPLNPGELYRLSLTGSGETTPLTALNAEFLQEIHVSEAEEIRTRSADGGEVQGWLLKPYQFDDNTSYPGVLEIHGGPHAMYGNTFFHELQLLAAKGFAVFYSNPRGSHGYGQQFVNAVRGDYGGMDYEDLMAFTDAVTARHPWIDSNRLGVTGGSYGGFMTNWILGQTDRFQAGATLRCISNWLSFYGVSDIGYFFTEWEVGADFLQDTDTLWNHSPIKYVNNITAPLLILHGEKDYRCPVEQAEQLFVALKMRGQDPRFVRFPEANHELSRSGPPHLRIARLDELTSWFEKHLLESEPTNTAL
ncbi:S9 family peptidase [Salisediminibacterium halotolerans]|uniref:S9 family peptidase n=1 Tax=Salisediminibacterium halotolerans TaxID=517425 RepID=UPI000EAEBEC0|nr:S9 family peptidase [Salisediminibacterium halotolerans]RLJ78345.1 dipeptidyl aminopeptidase/acylaminoacyl peptidase [Actinophytocola xinjiangensis]RPE88313.1 dipeptidyl aminopeptidase/acylaminoacyl peptidase [Salisediminibacterium halotolerans]TWG37321.1 dipeptidyl aminopeptidase/acylaminoacyl peptidase [Salisediminibacterium halotolerans]GEL06786.1 putative peptidase YuxL [Salisediminibacterium halotolerans]